MPQVRFGAINSANLRTPRQPISPLVNATSGVADGTLAEVKGSHGQVLQVCNDNFTELNNKLNEVIEAMKTCHWIA